MNTYNIKYEKFTVLFVFALTFSVKEYYIDVLITHACSIYFTKSYWIIKKYSWLTTSMNIVPDTAKQVAYKNTASSILRNTNRKCCQITLFDFYQANKRAFSSFLQSFLRDSRCNACKRT